MVTWKRMGILFAVTIGVGVTAIIFYRVGQGHLFQLIRNQHSGPWTSTVDLLAWAVPLALVIIELGTIAWAISGGVQQERARRRI